MHKRVRRLENDDITGTSHSCFEYKTTNGFSFSFSIPCFDIDVDSDVEK